MIPKTIFKMYEKDQKGRVLRAHNKHDDPMWFAETKEQLLAAFLKLFENNDANDYYSELSEPIDDSEVKTLEAQLAALAGNRILQAQYDETAKKLERAKKDLPSSGDRELYEAAVKGNEYAAFHLVHNRQDYEYESFDMVSVEDPLLEPVHE